MDVISATINVNTLDVVYASGNKHSIKINNIGDLELDARDNTVFVYIGSNRIRIEQSNRVESEALFTSIQDAMNNAL